MNLRQLDAFRAVMITASVTNAAEFLNVSQPAVSRLIADLERAIGFSLFVREKGSALAPTPEAESFYQEVDRNFAGLDALKRAADDIRNFRSGQLRIASLPALAMGFLPSVIQKFHALHPSVTVQLQTRSSATVRQWVAAQQFDLGLARPGEYPGVEAKLFANIPGVCVFPPGHRMTALDVVKPANFEDESFISLSTEDLSRARIDRVFEKAGVSRNIVVETQYAATICGLVLKGVGVSIINPITAMDFIERHLEARRFEPEIQFEYMLFLPKHKPLSRLTQSFLEILEEARDEAMELTMSRTVRRSNHQGSSKAKRKGDHS